MKAEIDLTLNQQIAIVRQLPGEQKIKLSGELERDAIESKLTGLLTEFQAKELTYEEITHEVGSVRQAIWRN